VGCNPSAHASWAVAGWLIKFVWVGGGAWEMVEVIRLRSWATSETVSGWVYGGACVGGSGAWVCGGAVCVGV
jgi:hypothetical protein